MFEAFSSPMSNAEKTLVTVATYNEIENLPLLVDEIFRYVPEANVLVVDDNSPDGTGRWVDERGARDPRVRCLHRAGKLGLGTATIAAMKYAVQHGYRYVLNMDADFSHPPKNLPDLIAAMDPPQGPPVDVAVGSRYTAGGGIEGWPFHRYAMSWGVNFYARTMLGLGPRDTSGAYRCHRVSKVAQLDFDSFISKGYSFQEEMMWRLKRIGARFVECPITFVDRVRGQSKINMKEAWRAVWIIARLGAKNWVGI
jgi:dolichol-phosphate mannosyltransferase